MANRCKKRFYVIYALDDDGELYTGNMSMEYIAYTSVYFHAILFVNYVKRNIDSKYNVYFQEVESEHDVRRILRLSNSTILSDYYMIYHENIRHTKFTLMNEEKLRELEEMAYQTEQVARPNVLARVENVMLPRLNYFRNEPIKEVIGRTCHMVKSYMKLSELREAYYNNIYGYVYLGSRDNDTIEVLDEIVNETGLDPIINFDEESSNDGCLDWLDYTIGNEYEWMGGLP